MPGIITYMKWTEKYLIQSRLQVKTHGIVLPNIHGIDKDVDCNLRPEKIIKSLSVPVQSHVPIELKSKNLCRKRVGQGKAGIERKCSEDLICLNHMKNQESPNYCQVEDKLFKKQKD